MTHKIKFTNALFVISKGLSNIKNNDILKNNETNFLKLAYLSTYHCF